MKMWMRISAVAAVALSTAACGGGNAEASDASDASETPASAVAAPAEAPAPTGTVVEVKMVTDGSSNYFEPAELTVRPGDVVRFTLVSGVHNVSFPGASSAAAGTLPAASPYLQTPGQSYDVPVTMPAGEYAFQCDPHVAFGMVGTLTVE